MKKRLLTMLLAVTLAMTVVSCGNTASQSGGASGNSASQEETGEAASQEETETAGAETAKTQAKEPGEVTFTDDLGRTITVNNPKRVTVLLSSFADVWQSAGGTIAATVHESWENDQVTLSDDVTDVGDFEQPDLEQILASEPDFIIATGNLDSQTALADQFETAGIPAAYFEVSNFDDYLHMLSVCTDITGRKDLYKTNGTDVEDEITALKSRITGEQPTVLVLRTSAKAGVKAKGSKGTVLGEVLADCGARNIADSDSGLLEDLSLEAIIKDDPDYIFVTSMGNDTEAAEKALEDALTGKSAWQSLSAVKNDRYYVMDKDLFNAKPNKRWAEAYQQIIDILYPEAK